MHSPVNSLSYSSSSSTLILHPIHKIKLYPSNSNWASAISLKLPPFSTKFSIKCSENSSTTLRTCKNCKTQFDPALNNPRACRFHTAHFGGETKRKFESVYTGGTMNTPNSGQVLQYWHCCGSEDPFDPGCTSAPHSSYDD